MDGKTFLVTPDVGESLHGIAGVAKDDSPQKIELSLEQAFEGGFEQMAAIGREVCRDMGDPGGCSHETEGKGTGSMNEFFRNIRTEKTDRHTVSGQMGSHILVSQGADCFDLFPYF